MSALFTLPAQIPLNAGAILPGAKLYFFQTATTTPQNTYQDDARSTAHANPVVADANGLFAPIYLDPTLPSYRVRLTTSADVQLFQYDNIPSNQNTQQSMRIESTSPNLILYDTNGTTNQRKYRMQANGNSLEFQALNDAESVATTFFAIEGGVTQRMVLKYPATAEDSGGTERALITQESGSFTATLSGMTASTTGTIHWWRSGTIYALQARSAIHGTSNATSMSMTGLPAGLLSQTANFAGATFVRDNGTLIVGQATVGTSSIIFAAGTPAGNFTNSGTKGLDAGWGLVYNTDQSGIA